MHTHFHRALIVVAVFTALSALSCTTGSTPDPTGTTPAVQRRVTEYTFRKVVGTTMTLAYTTINIDTAGDTTRTPGSMYRYTVVDTAFLRPDGKRCIAVQRETLSADTVRLTDTTYQWTDGNELITFERLLDSIGRRRLVEPVKTGTTFLLRSNLGNVETNRYSIVSVDTPITTAIGTFPAVHVRMASSSADASGSSTFTDEQWLVPNRHIVLQRQRRVFRPADGSAPTESIFEFTIVSGS